MNMVLLLKFWREGIIGILVLVLMGMIILVTNKTHTIDNLKQQHTLYVKEQSEIQLKAQVEAQQQLIQAEQTYNAKLKQISRDADLAHTRADSLSKQLTQANSRVKTARREAVEEYSRVQSNVLSGCITEYRNMAKIADEYRADAGKILIQ
ncbi:hypothetical protein [Acinetobacter sp. HY1485]|uniref:hypothetical protein n=1 Tax=Acinetobacter sp. HY1485 TaxID=2970918 RepID=UPI0022B9A041|nr:hypothetical protein [Acinetobacter sp. HY1485]